LVAAVDSTSSSTTSTTVGTLPLGTRLFSPGRLTTGAAGSAAISPPDCWMLSQ
jgi:hypothetical protein